MKRWLVLLLVLLFAGAPATAFWQSRDSNYNVSIASAPPSGSAWGDHGTNAALSTTNITNDTVTGLASSSSCVRGTQAHSLTGKYYFEVKFLTAPSVALIYIGIMDDTTASGAGMDAAPSSIPNSITNVQFNGNASGNGWNGTNIGSGWSLADNDRMGVAIDFDALASNSGFGYLSLINPTPTYFLGGDPTSGASGTGAVFNGGFPNARPALCVFGSAPSISGVVQLMTAASDLLFLPSGYTAWSP